MTIQQARDLIPLIDHTNLKEDATMEDILELGVLASDLGAAGVCVRPEHLHYVKMTTIGKVSTVVNFPTKDPVYLSKEQIVSQIRDVIHEEVDEIDLVLPFHASESNQGMLITACVNECRQADVKLKVILETARFKNAAYLNKVARNLCLSGADFLKTSTGLSVHGGASLQSVGTLLDAILVAGLRTGLKVSGGIDTVEQALEYIELIENKMGTDYITPETLRFGSSKLLKDIELYISVEEFKKGCNR